MSQLVKVPAQGSVGTVYIFMYLKKKDGLFSKEIVNRVFFFFFKFFAFSY